MRVAAPLLALLLLAPASVAAPPACPPTRPDALGPFYVPDAPERAVTGHGLVVAGSVRSARGCVPLPAARLEWWSADPAGAYDAAHRASQRVDAKGRFTYETSAPGRYPGRPPHLHVRVTAPGHRPLVTQLYPAPGQTRLDATFVLEVE